MSMVKFFSPDAWQNSSTDQHQIKIASGGLGLADKLAARKFASEELLHWLSLMKTSPDGVYVHKFAMSGSNRFGPNRWGDGFTDATLKRDIHTFETHAKAYRNHKSKKGSPYYGEPKIARFVDKTGVVELVTEYFGTDKLAASRGGHLADFEVGQLLKYGSIPVSMGSHVPGDECTACGNWAPTRKQHCESKAEGGCCTLFGCKNGMLKIAADGQQQYVDNPYNCFFDISAVQSGADPVAYGLLLPLGKFDEDSQIKMAEFATAIHSDIIDQSHRAFDADHNLMAKLAYVLADIEQAVRDEPIDDITAGFVKTACFADLTGLFSGSKAVRQQTIRDLAASQQLPSFEQFARAGGYSESEIKLASGFVPDIFTRLIREKILHSVIDTSILTNNSPQEKLASREESLRKPDVVQRGIEANYGAKIEKRTPADLSAVIPTAAIKFAEFKLGWACSARLNVWLTNGLVLKDTGVIGSESKSHTRFD